MNPTNESDNDSGVAECKRNKKGLAIMLGASKICTMKLTLQGLHDFGCTVQARLHSLWS